MAFKTWQTGVHIQQDRVLIVALVRERLSWCLRCWWAIPLTEGIILDGKICQPEQLFDALRGWRRTLPHQHRVFLSFPAARTLQRSLPRPAITLRDSEQLSWLGAALSRELEMSPDALCFDYAQDTFSNTFHVTAAQNKEVETLLTLAKTLHLRLVTITPDASALANFLPAVAPAQCVAWRDRLSAAGNTDKAYVCVVRVLHIDLITPAVVAPGFNRPDDNGLSAEEGGRSSLAVSPRCRSAVPIMPSRWRWP
ncbi:DNA utilization protein HofM [Enterobacter sp. RC4]|uniref:DNA utilization protein HofM n=1 Tax=Enterobacter sp. RC4 TaxID=1495129 RepID=UPI001F5274F6|nr:DNA utilization protein HofM [Enterobacter sp. RC4]